MKKIFLLSIFMFVVFSLYGQTYGHYGKKNIINFRPSLTALSKEGGILASDWSNYIIRARAQFSYERILTNRLSLSVNFIASNSSSLRLIGDDLDPVKYFSYEDGDFEYYLEFVNPMRLTNNVFFSELKYNLKKTAPYGFNLAIGGGIAVTNISEYSDVLQTSRMDEKIKFTHEEFIEFEEINYNNSPTRKLFVSLGTGYRFPLNKYLILGSYTQVLLSSHPESVDTSNRGKVPYNDLLTYIKLAHFRSINYSLGIEINFLF